MLKCKNIKKNSYICLLSLVFFIAGSSHLAAVPSSANRPEYFQLPVEPRDLLSFRLAIGVERRRLSLLNRTELVVSAVYRTALTHQTLDLVSDLRHLKLEGRLMDRAMNGQLIKLEKNYLDGAYIKVFNLAKIRTLQKERHYVLQIYKMFLELTDLFAKEKITVRKRLVNYFDAKGHFLSERLRSKPIESLEETYEHKAWYQLQTKHLDSLYNLSDGGKGTN